MKKENMELMEQVLTAIYAKDKLEAVENLVNKIDTDFVDKQKLKEIFDNTGDSIFDD